MIDVKTNQAVAHTLHCLLGCSIGEILGMAVSTAFGWSNLVNIILSILLAFFFGYSLTAWSLYKKGVGREEAIKIAVATDTVSIISMETVDNAFILLVPGAINAGLTTSLFWISLIASLIIAFVLTVPVNRWFMGKGEYVHH